MELYTESPDGRSMPCQMTQGNPLPGSAKAFTYSTDVASSRPASDYTPRVIGGIPEQAFLWKTPTFCGSARRLSRSEDNQWLHDAIEFLVHSSNALSRARNSKSMGRHPGRIDPPRLKQANKALHTVFVRLCKDRCGDGFFRHAHAPIQARN